MSYFFLTCLLLLDILVMRQFCFVIYLIFTLNFIPFSSKKIQCVCYQILYPFQQKRPGLFATKFYTPYQCIFFW